MLREGIIGSNLMLDIINSLNMLLIAIYVSIK